MSLGTMIRFICPTNVRLTWVQVSLAQLKAPDRSHQDAVTFAPQSSYPVTVWELQARCRLRAGVSQHRLRCNGTILATTHFVWSQKAPEALCPLYDDCLEILGGLRQRYGKSGVGKQPRGEWGRRKGGLGGFPQRCAAAGTPY